MIKVSFYHILKCTWLISVTVRDSSKSRLIGWVSVIGLLSRILLLMFRSTIYFFVIFCYFYFLFVCFELFCGDCVRNEEWVGWKLVYVLFKFVLGFIVCCLCLLCFVVGYRHNPRGWICK